jgi:hypothetical protein
MMAATIFFINKEKRSDIYGGNRQQISQTVLPQLVTRCPEIFPSS